MEKKDQIPAKDQIPGKVITVNTPIDREFFRCWLAFLRPVHKLTPNQMDVFASILFHRYELSKDIVNTDVLDQVALSSESRKSIRDSLGMTTTHFQVVMSALKKNKVIVDDKIDKRYIPGITDSTEMFRLSVYFKLK